MAKKKKEESGQPLPNLGFGISKINIGHLMVQNQFEEIDLDKLQLNISWDLVGIKNENQLNVMVQVKYYLDGEEQVSLHVNNNFMLFNPKILESEPEKGVPLEFMRVLVNLSIGTTRGVLAQATAGTIWANFPLPLQNIAEIVPDGTQKFLS